MHLSTYLVLVAYLVPVYLSLVIINFVKRAYPYVYAITNCLQASH